MRAKMSREERAKQFMPFAALRGYGEEIAEKNRIKCEKKELAEEDQAEISKILSSIKRGEIVTVKYYDKDSYLTLTGSVAKIDDVTQELILIKTTIKFDDIYSISQDE